MRRFLLLSAVLITAASPASAQKAIKVSDLAGTWSMRTMMGPKDSVVTHTPSGRRTSYGALAARAAQIKLPNPEKIKIKGPDQFTLIGTEQKNLDVPLKVTGKAIYGIDVDLPGMLQRLEGCGGLGRLHEPANANAVPGIGVGLGTGATGLHRR